MRNDMQERLMGFTAFVTVVFVVVAMAVMLRFASSKTIVVAEEVTAGSGAEQEYAMKKEDSITLSLREETKTAPSICIPLPEEVRPDDIVIENHYMEHRINVIITGAPIDYYRQKEISGGVDKIKAAACYEEKDSVVLAFQMDGLYEHKYLLEENALYLDFVNPHEMYERIVVLDAGHGGTDAGVQTHGLTEKELTLSIVTAVRDKLAESGVRVYCTRQQDEEVLTERRAAFINELRPDFVVSVHFNAGEDSGTYGTEVWYNGAFVIPVYGNPELADVLERSVVKAAEGKAAGLVDCVVEKPDSEETAFLEELRVPAVVLEAGYLTNERERALFAQPGHTERITEGICGAVQEAADRFTEAVQAQQ